MPLTPRDPLRTYRDKRNPDRTPEPVGDAAGPAPSPGAPRFVVHKHSARRLHYDLRLEVDGVLWSWAVPMGPSRDPAEKRLAVHTEDHPLEYYDFEDVIPEGNYGAGAMIAWDQGTYVPLHPMLEGLEAGKLLFDLRGHKLRGAWTLVKLRKAEEDAWLLIKERDALATSGPDDFPEDSVLSGLTVEELAAGEDPAVSIREELNRLKAPRSLLDPLDTRLMLAETAPGPFSRPDWVFEFKYDGYRTLAFREDDDVRLLSRRGNDMSSTFPELTAALARLPFRRFLLDGEIVVEDENGIPSFQRLQQRGQLRRTADIRRGQITFPARLWLFDLIGFEDRDLRRLPLTERKRILRSMLPSTGTLRFSEHIERHGEALFEQAASIGLEGVIGKKANGVYREGRSSEWLKVRATRTDDFVIVGWTAPKGGRSGFGAIYLAQWEDGELRFMGQAGSGFTDRQIREIHSRLEARRRPTPPCARAPKAKGSSWTEPRLVAEIRYLERTDDGLLRQPVFMRLREDKSPAECVAQGGSIAPEEPTTVEEAISPEPAAPEERSARERRSPTARRSPPAGSSAPGQGSTGGPPAAPSSPDAGDPTGTRGHRASRGAGAPRRSAATPSGGVERAEPAGRTRGDGPPSAALRAGARTVHFTNLDKVLWPEDGFTKGHLIDYYRAIAPWILPFLRDRPVVLTRFPDGIHGKSFFQKDAPAFAPKWLRTVRLPDEDDGDETPAYFIGDDEETLLYLANSASIPLHIWSSRVASIETPDWCILDLDPKEAPFEHVVEVALAARALCEECALPVHVKTSGSSGIHLLVPMGRLLDHDQVKSFGELLARVLVRRLPRIATITRQVERRGGKVYIDYLQNGRGKLLVAPYSVRPLPGAPVSVPLRWEEVTPDLEIRAHTIRTVPQRVRRLRDDPLLPVLTTTPDLLGALERLQERV